MRSYKKIKILCKKCYFTYILFIMYVHKIIGKKKKKKKKKNEKKKKKKKKKNHAKYRMLFAMKGWINMEENCFNLIASSFDSFKILRIPFEKFSLILTFYLFNDKLQFFISNVLFAISHNLSSWVAITNDVL